MIIKTVYFEITNRCNLNCVTCYNRSGLNKEPMEISPEQLKTGIEILLQYGLDRVLISGGEPVLHSKFDKILELLKEYPQYSFGFVTNGTVYSRKFIDELNKNENFDLQISLDGSAEKLNTKTRGTGNFDKTMEFIRKIHKKQTPRLKMVVSQNNINDIEDFYRLAVSVGFIPEITFITRRGNAEEGWDMLSLTAKQKFDILKRIDNLNHMYNKEAFLPLCTSGCPYSADEMNLSICVKPNGEIQPCSLLYEPEHSLGNIFNFKENYFFDRIAYISKLAISRKSVDYNCGKCILGNNCQKGCIAAAYLFSGDVFANDGECDYRKMQLVGFDLKNLQKK